jgi:hypothetical protein
MCDAVEAATGFLKAVAPGFMFWQCQIIAKSAHFQLFARAGTRRSPSHLDLGTPVSNRRSYEDLNGLVADMAASERAINH